MMAGKTPSYAAAATILHDPASTVCLVGYCDPDTPGGQLIATECGADFLFADLDYQTPLLAKVERFDLSGHADREELLDYAVRSAPAKILLIHGDALAREWFRDRLAESLPSAGVLIPEALTQYEI
jgi:Cft2 family RNA processing exonuclease